PSRGSAGCPSSARPRRTAPLLRPRRRAPRSCTRGRGSPDPSRRTPSADEAPTGPLAVGHLAATVVRPELVLVREDVLVDDLGGPHPDVVDAIVERRDGVDVHGHARRWWPPGSRRTRGRSPDSSADLAFRPFPIGRPDLPLQQLA